MRHYWTRFLLLYPKTLVFMLQGSEYRARDYFSWLRRTTDFRKVANRRKLDYTPKARLLLISIWILLLALYGLGVYLLVQSFLVASATQLTVALGLLFVAPAVVSNGIVIPLLIGQKLIQEPRQKALIQSASLVIAKHPAFKIAIAGSFGKTTVKEILTTVLSEGKRVASTPGNMNTPIGISRFALTLDGTEEVLIFELGEEQFGDVRQMCDLTVPDMGIITGINEAHLSSFGTLSRTVETIFGLQDYLGKKPLYKNRESSLVAARIRQNDTLAYTSHGVDGWVVSQIQTDIHGTSFVATKGSRVLPVHTGLLGDHNIGPIVTAISIAGSLGLTDQQIIDGVAKTMPFEHRMQPRLVQGAWVIDDTYNGNSQGFRAGLHLLGQLTAKRRVYITPGLVEQGDKTAEVHETIGIQAAAVADVVVLMKNSVTDFIVSGLTKSKFDGKLLIIDNPLEFYTNLDQFVASGDVVLMQNDWTDNYA